MAMLWRQSGKVVRSSEGPQVCRTEYCPCHPPETGCQCYLVYMALWCPEEVHLGEAARWLSVAEAQTCLGVGCTGVTSNIFYITDNAGDGCADISQYEFDEGFQGWCRSGNIYYCAPCGWGAYGILNYYVGPMHCYPCDGSTDGCVRPTSFPSLPADPLSLGMC